MYPILFRVLIDPIRPWCWEGLRARGEGDDRGWDGWMASLTRWPWVWVNSGSWWWTGRPCVLRFMGSQRVRHDWATELNWTESASCLYQFLLPYIMYTLSVCFCLIFPQRAISNTTDKNAGKTEWIDTWKDFKIMLVDWKNHIYCDIYYIVVVVAFCILTFRIQVRFFHLFFNCNRNW